MEDYSAQDNIQVLSVLEKIIDQISIDHPLIEELMLGSDNASCFDSHDNIPFIHHRNKRNENKIQICNWVYTEACTGENRLDTHFSFLAMILKYYILENNNIKDGKDMYDALLYETGLAGTNISFV